MNFLTIMRRRLYWFLTDIAQKIYDPFLKYNELDEFKKSIQNNCAKFEDIFPGLKGFNPYKKEGGFIRQKYSPQDIDKILNPPKKRGRPRKVKK